MAMRYQPGLVKPSVYVLNTNGRARTGRHSIIVAITVVGSSDRLVMETPFFDGIGGGKANRLNVKAAYPIKVDFISATSPIAKRSRKATEVKAVRKTHFFVNRSLTSSKVKEGSFVPNPLDRPDAQAPSRRAAVRNPPSSKAARNGSIKPRARPSARF